MRNMVLLMLLALAAPAFAEYENIKQTFVATVVNAQTIAASGTYTGKAFTPLIKTTAQSAQVKGTGTSPNYKVEILVSIDGTTFVKPETGGDLGTFTDQNAHIMAINVPLSLVHKLKITELGGANSITITAQEVCQ